MVLFLLKFAPGLVSQPTYRLSSGLIKLCLDLVSDFKANSAPKNENALYLYKSEQIMTGVFFFFFESLGFRGQVVLFLQGWGNGSVLG